MSIFETSIFGIHIAPTWYGLMYAFGFIICYYFLKKNINFRNDDLDTLLVFIFFGVIIGGRLGYIFLYNPSYYFKNISEIIAIWKGGMSFHGGCIGVILATLSFSYVKKYSFWNIIDTLAIIIPVALGLGRIGNYINSELPGYSPYTGYFPLIKDGVSYFPSPLFEMCLEGIILFSIMFFSWRFIRKSGNKFLNSDGIFSALFLIGYSFARIISEQFRLPDEHIGYIGGTNWLTLGILYTLPMLILGIGIIMLRFKNLQSNIAK